MKILNQLLWQNNNKAQIIGAVIGSFLGLLLLLLSIQFYMDLQTLTQGGGSGTDQFVIINKQVTILNTIGKKAAFSDEEVQMIGNQSFTKKVGTFTPNNYKVSASISSLGFYTELFFESVPDEFIDVDDSRFQWSTGQRELPIILSKDYLALYNFGFAPSQGLPQFTSSTIQKVGLDITVRGNGRREVYRGRIIGFSDRINSILVPQTFMDFTNNSFRDFKPKGSSRLIVLVENPYSKVFQNFLKTNGYELSTGRLIGGEVASMIRSLITAVAAIGFLIVLLSVLVFVLNFQLIVSKSSRDIGLMMQLGYKQNQIAQILKKHLLSIFGVVILLTIVFFAITRYFIVNWFTQQGMALGNVHWIVFVAALLFSVLFVVINFSTIQKSIHKLS